MGALKDLFAGGRGERRDEARRTPEEAWAWVDSYRYRLTNMNRNAVRIAPDRGNLVPRQSVTFRLDLPLGEKPVQVPLAGVVLRQDGDGLVIRFAEPQPFFRKLIDRYLGQG